MKLVIVESPAKAKTINKYLGSDYKVLASFGHIRDLPSKDGSVQPDHDFAMTWELSAGGKKRLNDIIAAVKDADTVILASDPDREGEAIAWHILEELKARGKIKDKKIERVVFHEITKSAVTEAIKNPRQIDDNLVSAYMARRALDYLVGFTLSPVLWRKLPGSKSAGRVQSVALRLICDRETEIENFKPEEYWTIDAELFTSQQALIKSRLIVLDGKKLEKFDINSEEKALAARHLPDNRIVFPGKIEGQIDGAAQGIFVVVFKNRNLPVSAVNSLRHRLPVHGPQRFQKLSRILQGADHLLPVHGADGIHILPGDLFIGNSHSMIPQAVAQIPQVHQKRQHIVPPLKGSHIIGKGSRINGYPVPCQHPHHRIL